MMDMSTATFPENVSKALADGIQDDEGLLDAAYPEVPAHLRWAARLSLARSGAA